MRDLFDDLLPDDVSLDNAAVEGAAVLTPQSVLKETPDLLRLLDQWVELGWLRSLDAALVRFFDRETRAAGQPAPPLLLLAASLASHQLGRGHVCLDLQTTRQEGLDDTLSLPPEDQVVRDHALLPSELLADVPLTTWQTVLEHPLLVADGTDSEAAGNTPLVRDGLRLYLRRYWQYEQSIYARLSRRMEHPAAMADAESAPAKALAGALAALFPSARRRDYDPDWQRVACANSARHGFSIITGGPGTGKTTTVVKLLAALQSVALNTGDQPRALRIRLAAPTGKAAARLNESIAGAVAGLDLSGLPEGDQCRRAIPTDVTTLHRLLGSIPGSRRFRHDRDNLLVVDVLVIDEASMVDIEMMARVLEALPNGARLILLGDKDQLASVDAGAVMGELCQRAFEGRYTDATAQWLETVSGVAIPPQLRGEQGRPLDQVITLLRTSYRFDAASGIGQLAAAVNQPAGASEIAASAVRTVFAGGYQDIVRLSIDRKNPTPGISQHAVQGGAQHFSDSGLGRRIGSKEIESPVGYGYYLKQMAQTRPGATEPLSHFDDWARTTLEAYGQFQVLCALRRGPFGVEGLNENIANALKRAKLISTIEGWYPGRPVLVTRNDYSLGLMNGDIGITLALPARHWLDGREVIEPEREVLRVAFPAGDGSGGIHWILPSRLQGVETVYAMTVHKSQGSEFAHTCLVMPDKLNPVLTRELVYTGITRARHWFSLLLPDNSVFDQAVTRQVTRTSGLGRLLLD
ncbi:MAG: exodeoxyribonuclease V subunit alpha [Marinobacter sp.]|uniref:exodeoxyribonuclease V subunit alpha n=1 Tax=Marinobacter sp. TaxID=50741 RepID=UPI00349FF3C7